MPPIDEEGQVDAVSQPRLPVEGGLVQRPSLIRTPVKFQGPSNACTTNRKIQSRSRNTIRGKENTAEPFSLPRSLVCQESPYGHT